MTNTSNTSARYISIWIRIQWTICKKLCFPFSVPLINTYRQPVELFVDGERWPYGDAFMWILKTFRFRWHRTCWQRFWHRRMHGVKRVMPAFTKGKMQLSQQEVEVSQRIARERIHVWRVRWKISTPYSRALYL